MTRHNHHQALQQPSTPKVRWLVGMLVATPVGLAGSALKIHWMANLGWAGVALTALAFGLPAYFASAIKPIANNAGPEFPDQDWKVAEQGAKGGGATARQRRRQRKQQRAEAKKETQSPKGQNDE